MRRRHHDAGADLDGKTALHCRMYAQRLPLDRYTKGTVFLVVGILSLTVGGIAFMQLIGQWLAHRQDRFLVPASPPRCGSVPQLVGVSIDDKRDRCGADALLRGGVALATGLVAVTAWSLWPRDEERD